MVQINTGTNNEQIGLPSEDSFDISIKKENIQQDYLYNCGQEPIQIFYWTVQIFLSPA